jgi:hypothetical protein
MDKLYTTLLGRACTILIMGGTIKGTIVSEAFLKPVDIVEQEYSEKIFRLDPTIMQANEAPADQSIKRESPFRGPGFAQGPAFQPMFGHRPQELKLHFLILTEKGKIEPIPIERIEVDMPEA